jgi:hypothetical protein
MAGANPEIKIVAMARPTVDGQRPAIDLNCGVQFAERQAWHLGNP